MYINIYIYTAKGDRITCLHIYVYISIHIDIYIHICKNIHIYTNINKIMKYIENLLLTASICACAAAIFAIGILYE
jgi:hypothetical protein